MNKFLLLLKNELYHLRYKYLLIIAIIAVVYTVPLLFVKTDTTNILTILSLTYILISIIMVAAPFYLSGFLHQDKRSFFYAMRPANQIKKYSLILIQCFIVVPVIVFMTSRLFENSFTALNWVKYIADETSFWESADIASLFSLGFMAVLINTSMSIFSVNLFKYKKIVKSIMFLYLLPYFIIFPFVIYGPQICPSFWNFMEITLTPLFASPNAPYVVNIIILMIVAAINYITWRVFKNKQV